MAGTADVMNKVEKPAGTTYQVLVPNMKGLEGAFAVLDSQSKSKTIDEIAIFTAATDEFAKANTNCTVAESLARLAPVTRAALDRGLKVRGYVSVVITCPYSGKVDYNRVREVTRELFEMGCYEVSLGDTTGTGNPTSVGEMLETVLAKNPVEKLAVSFILYSIYTVIDIVLTLF
jgi:hydroxymethylglutaryl-CoA lyase